MSKNPSTKKKVTEALLVAIVRQLVALYRHSGTSSADVQALGAKALDLISDVRVNHCGSVKNAAYWLSRAAGSAYCLSLDKDRPKGDFSLVLYALSQARLELRKEERALAALREERA